MHRDRQSNNRGKELLLKIGRLEPYLNPALKKIANYILRNSEKIKLLRIDELAKECAVSEATVTRFVKKIEIEGFQKLKICLAELGVEKDFNETEEKKFIYDDIAESDSIENIIEKIAFKNISALQETKKMVNPREIKKAVSAIEKADFLVIYCVGTSIIAAESAKMRFYRVGKRTLIYNDPANQLVSASLLGKGNVAIGISNSGRSAPTVNALKMAQQSGSTTICITNSDSSPIIEYSDIKLFSATKGSSFFQESMASRIAQTLIVDILYASYAVRQYKRSIALLEKSASALNLGLYLK